MIRPRLFLQEHRKGLGFSLRGLAERSGVDFTTIDRIERGERDPRLSTLYSLANALDIQVQDLFAQPLKKKRKKRK